ncbi:MAG: glycosyltransferase family 47 protein [Granulosicoccus sp.]|nr:glycosyltransferase family 47 protein [Granulosicoccus sp.]
MKLLLTSAYQSHSCLDRLYELAKLNACGSYSLTSSAENADAIVFVENTQFDDLGFKQLLDHPLVSEHADKVFMYNEMDQSWPVLPGLYCSLSDRLANPKDHIAFPYLSSGNPDIRHIYESSVDRPWLYSFVGSGSHPIRKQLFKLKSENGRILDTSEYCLWNPRQTSARAYQSLYSESMARSKFVLCPRGIGPSSLRLYETMQAGRIPVIISDHWVAPPQVSWDFAVRVRESEIDSIPLVLENLQDEWKDRSEAARQAWESAFSPEQLFSSFGAAIEQLSHSAEIRKQSLFARLHKTSVIVEYALKNSLKGHRDHHDSGKLQHPIPVRGTPVG